MDRPGRCEAKRCAVLFRDFAPRARQIAPHLASGRIEIGPRRAEIAFGAADRGLNGVVLAHRLDANRRLAARQLDGRVERGARDAERDRGEAQPEHGVSGEPVERPLFTQGRGIVAQCCEFFGDEKIVDRIRVGAGAVEADHVPDVVHRGARYRKENGAHFRRAVGLAPPGAVGFDDLDMGAEPARLTGAAGEIPARGGTIAAGNDLHLVGDRAPGEDAVRCAENFSGRLGIEISRRHGADGALAEAPCRRGVGLRYFL